MRLDRYLSNAKVGSRSHVKKLIRDGMIKVNGNVILDPAYKLKPTDQVSLKDELITPHRLIYLLFNKPVGYVSDRTDSEASIFDLIDHPYVDELHVAGRLDKDVEGMLILTNDGQFTHRLIGPKYRVEREYHVIFNGEVNQEKFERAFKGVFVGKDVLRPQKIELISQNLLRIILTEGKYHEVKRIMRYLGLSYVSIRRVRMGSLSLGDLPTGSFRELNDEEKNLLFLNP